MMRWEATREEQARRARTDAERATARERRRLERQARRRPELEPWRQLRDEVVIAIALGAAFALVVILASRAVG